MPTKPRNFDNCCAAASAADRPTPDRRSVKLRHCRDPLERRWNAASGAALPERGPTNPHHTDRSNAASLGRGRKSLGSSAADSIHSFGSGLTPGSTAGCRRFDLHSIPSGPLHPEVRRRLRKIATDSIGKIGQLGIGPITVAEVRSNLGNSAIAHRLPLAPSHHEAQDSAFGGPQAAPLADDFVALSDDVVNLPGRIKTNPELTPVLG